MLKQLGRLEHTRNIIIVGFILLLVVSLIVFFAPGRSATYLDPSRNTEVVAEVGSDEITVADVARIRESYSQMFGGSANLAQLGGNKRFLDGLIRDRVIAQEAERLELAASDAEVAERIRKQFTDASGQFIGLDKYRDAVTARYGDVETFERDVRDSIAQEKLRAFVTSSVTVSDDEVEEQYKRDKITVNLSYIIVSADKLASKIQVPDDELRSYYDQHKDDYRLNEPQKKVRYVYINQEKAGSKLQIPDTELRKEFEQLRPENKEAGVKVQQIVLRVARKDLDPEVEQKAKDLITKIRGADGKASEQAFAELARGNSEDPATAKNGGFLSRLIKKNPKKPDALYERAVDMQPGDVSDIPIRYAGDWYILRRGDTVYQTFEEAKATLVVSSRNRRSYAVAAKLAQRAEARLKETKDPKKVAEELARDDNMTPAEMVKENPYIKSKDDVPDIGSNEQFEQAIAPLNNKDDVGVQVGVKGGFAIPIFVDKKDPRIPDFEEVKDKIADSLKNQRAKEQLEQKAREMASTAKSPDEIKAAGEKAGFEAGTEEDWKLGSAVGKAGTSAALDEAVFALKAGEVTQTPVKVGENWVVLGARSRVEADMAAFASQRDTLTRTLTSERQNQVWGDYVAAVQDRLKREGRIKIYKEVLDTLIEEEPAAAPRRFPQIPVPTQ
ncbi:MAG TPA: SurA N-terminal domain-containing protein [Pyrinomonadaceae bacterium]|nr:SurA N-terminal domain-containing protein [Pyrinomonadaceae bacterium]